MKPQLADDVSDGAEALTLQKNVESFLIGLGQQDEVEIDPDDVRVRALPLISSGLHRSPHLPRATFDQDFDQLEFRTEVTDGTIERVERAQRFMGELGEILLVDATWRLRFRLLYRERPPADDTVWFVVDKLAGLSRPSEVGDRRRAIHRRAAEAQSDCLAERQWPHDHGQARQLTK